jgi:transcriptional regulator with XRE-family HTH domain
MIGASMADVLRLTYRELARRLGLTPDGARFLARRRMWPIESGNDGRKVIIVSEAELAAEVERTADDQGMSRGSSPDDRGMNGASGQADDALAELRERLGRAEGEVAELRQRVDELRGARDAALAQVADLRVELATAQGEVAARDAVQAELRAQVTWLRRPWWQKLIGS